MTALLVLLAWVALSVLAAMSWAAYRTFVARHSLEEFDPKPPVRTAPSRDRVRGLASVPMVPGPRPPLP